MPHPQRLLWNNNKRQWSVQRLAKVPLDVTSCFHTPSNLKLIDSSLHILYSLPDYFDALQVSWQWLWYFFLFWKNSKHMFHRFNQQKVLTALMSHRWKKCWCKISLLFAIKLTFSGNKYISFEWTTKLKISRVESTLHYCYPCCSKRLTFKMAAVFVISIFLFLFLNSR